jgi:hypothetical protein
MKPVQRHEIIDFATYEETREAERERLMKIKAPRRIHVAPHLTFLFENRDTVRYQVQEMTRVERIVKEADIQHELDTYNELLGGVGELGCTLLIEIESPEERAEKLRAWCGLPEHLFLKLADGRLVRPRFDPRQVGEDRLSSVQYLRFDTGGEVPVMLGADHPALEVAAELSREQQEALRRDLADA